MKLNKVLTHTAAITLAFVAGLASAQAQTITMKAGQETSLPDCQGTLEVRVAGETQLNLIFRDVVNCSNFDIYAANGSAVDYPNKKLGGYDRARSGSFTIPKSLIQFGSNEIIVVVKSNSGKTSDKVRVKFSLISGDTITINQKKALTDCGGTIEVLASDNGYEDQVNLVFRDVEFCSNFDILSANGLALDYPNKKLTLRRDGTRGGSFTLPKELIREGLNKIIISIQSNSGSHHDQVAVKFEAEFLPPWLRFWLGL